MNPDDANSLCLECGLCCNGVIFADVQLRPADNAVRLRALGLAFAQKSKAGIEKFKQPCTAFGGCKCNIYSERPAYCRQFECLLLKSVKAGEVKISEARRVIRAALKQAETVKRLLRELGDAEETLALNKRFQRIQRKVERGPCGKGVAHTFGELTLAVHELNMLLSERFYRES
jgi:Fe-S-cluster containining protein